MGSISFINKGGSGGGSSSNIKPNVFMQDTEPETKEGIWIKANKQFNKIYLAKNLSGDFEKESVIILNDSDKYRAALLPVSIDNIVGKLENSFNDVYYYSDTTASSGNKTFMYEGQKYTIPAQALFNEGNYKYIFYAVKIEDDRIYFYSVGSNSPITVDDTGTISSASDLSGVYDFSKKNLQDAIDGYAKGTILFTYNTLIITSVVWTNFDMVNTETGEVVYPRTIPEGIDNTLPTYYGTGTEWVKFKN